MSRLPLDEGSLFFQGEPPGKASSLFKVLPVVANPVMPSVGAATADFGSKVTSFVNMPKELPLRNAVAFAKGVRGAVAEAIAHNVQRGEQGGAGGLHVRSPV